LGENRRARVTLPERESHRHGSADVEFPFPLQTETTYRPELSAQYVLFTFDGKCYGPSLDIEKAFVASFEGKARRPDLKRFRSPGSKHLSGYVEFWLRFISVPQSHLGVFISTSAQRCATSGMCSHDGISHRESITATGVLRPDWWLDHQLRCASDSQQAAAARGSGPRCNPRCPWARTAKRLAR
jgi:hypothetical protein